MTVTRVYLHPFRHPRIKWPGASGADVIKRTLWYFVMFLIFEVLGAGLLPALILAFQRIMVIHEPFSMASLIQPTDILLLCSALAFTRIPDLLEHHDGVRRTRIRRYILLAALLLIGVEGSIIGVVTRVHTSFGWALGIFLLLYTTFIISVVFAIRAASEVSEAHERTDKQNPDFVYAPGKAQVNHGLISRVSVYEQLAALLRQEIDAGRAGAQLPSQSALTQRYGVSRSTVHRAVMTLVETGYVRIIRGQGMFVIPPAERQAQNA
jgi:hypothetical protein